MINSVPVANPPFSSRLLHPYVDSQGVVTYTERSILYGMLMLGMAAVVPLAILLKDPNLSSRPGFVWTLVVFVVWGGILGTSGLFYLIRKRELVFHSHRRVAQIETTALFLRSHCQCPIDESQLAVRPLRYRSHGRLPKELKHALVATVGNQVFVIGRSQNQAEIDELAEEASRLSGLPVQRSQEPLVSRM